jgi:hypothetical protein
MKNFILIVLLIGVGVVLSQFAKSPFNSGKVKQLHQQLVQLSEYLQDKKIPL